MSAHQSKTYSAQPMPGNEWLSRLEAETARGDSAESTLRATQVEAADIMLRATESAEALLAFAQDAAQQVVRTAQEKAESVLALANETAEQLLKEAEEDGRFESADAVSTPSPEAARQADWRTNFPGGSVTRRLSGADSTWTTKLEPQERPGWART